MKMHGERIAAIASTQARDRSIALGLCVSAATLMWLATRLPPMRLFAERPEDLLSVHLLLEMISVMVSLLVVSIAWHGVRSWSFCNALIVGFLVVAFADIMHAMVYEGMPSLITGSSTSKAIFFWLMGRSAEVVTVLLAAFKISLPGSRWRWLGVATLINGAIFYVGIYRLDWFPTVFIPGQGLTPFKIWFEYGICFANVAAAVVLYRNSRSPGDRQSIWLAAACMLVSIGSVAFTNYVATSDAMLLFGHIYKIAAYALIYRATFLEGVREPYTMLQEQENKLNDILSKLPIGVAKIDPDLRFQYVNQSLAKVIGAQHSQIEGRRLSELLSDTAVSLLEPHLREALKGKSTIYNSAVKDPLGTLRHVHIVLMPEFSMQGRVSGILATYTDITAREVFYRQLRESLTRFQGLRAALDAHAIVSVADTQRIITDVNDKFCEVFQYSREELIGNSYDKLMSQGFPNDVISDMRQATNAGKVWSGEVCNRAKDGSDVWVHNTVVPLTNSQGEVTEFISIRADITERKRAQAAAQHMAFYDPLTELPNRRLMLDRLQQALTQAQRQRANGALVLIDLDNFKEINDTLGHHLGDELLRQVGLRLKSDLRASDTVARLGGDEFVLILTGLHENLPIASAQAASLCETVRQTLGLKYSLESHSALTTPSMGVVMFQGAAAGNELLKQADMALYKAKAEGGNRLHFFDPALQADVIGRADTLRDLRLALERNELRLFYQPVVNAEGHAKGVEALVRWQHPQRGMVSPAQFIPLAEQTDLIVGIGGWVLHRACEQIKAWQDDPHLSRLSIAVNVSARQFRESDFVAQVKGVINRTGAPAHLLRLELTESMLHHDLQTTIETMRALRDIGIRFSLDDFGTGYSSLSYLKRLPLTQLKIDKSFVDDVLTDTSDTAITRSILALARSLELEVVAEGVETQEQLTFLKAEGCRVFQGYYFGRPAPMEQLVLSHAQPAQASPENT